LTRIENTLENSLNTKNINPFLKQFDANNSLFKANNFIPKQEVPKTVFWRSWVPVEMILKD
jgi:hypothetical protein